MISLAGLLIYSAALFVAAASPGPGIAAIVARVLARGKSGAFAFTAGVAIGDVVWLTIAILGLAAIAQAFQGVFLAVKYAGAAYLLYLAYKIFTAPAELAAAGQGGADEKSWKLLLGGLAVTMGNPKVMVFYLAITPNLVDINSITPASYAALAGVTLAILAIVFSLYIFAAGRARRLIANPKAMKIVNRCTGSIMAGAAIGVAVK